MQKLSYYLFLAIIIPLSKIPLSLLYRLSDALYYILYYLVKYRKKVVFSNLQYVFPNKSINEITQIAKNSYVNLCDIFIESLAGYQMQGKTIAQQFKVLNPQVLDKYALQGKSAVIVGGHYCNWEWGISLSLQLKHQVVVFYKPINNKLVSNYVIKSRTKWGVHIASILNTPQTFEKYLSAPAAFAMISDQSPSNKEKALWVNFLGKQTACLHGPEKYAKQYNLPVIYYHIERIKRGHYHITLKELFSETQNLPEGTITQSFMHNLEQTILKNPSNWLWSHKRWKHKQD